MALPINEQVEILIKKISQMSEPTEVSITCHPVNADIIINSMEKHLVRGNIIEDARLPKWQIFIAPVKKPQL